MLNGKVAVITGGTKGIGYATAIKMAEEQAIVYVCARNERIFKQENILYKKLDVSDFNSCNEVFQSIVAEQGKIDILVADLSLIHI